MKRLAVLTIPLLFATPAFAADLDGPVYSERDIYIERPAPPRVVERRYYVPAPTVEYYDDEPAYAYSYGYYPRRTWYADNHWRARHYYYPRWRHHHDRWHHR